MPELPITRLVRHLLHRNDRPVGSADCAECGTLVPYGSGEWDRVARLVYCGSGSCVLEAAASRSW